MDNVASEEAPDPPTEPVMAPPVPVEPRARRLRLKFSDILAVLALVVSIGSVTISFTQTGNVKRQLQLAELQIRPYIRYKPRFIEDGNDQLDISMISENHSAIPGNVIYDQLKIWIDDKTTSAFVSSTVPYRLQILADGR